MRRYFEVGNNEEAREVKIRLTMLQLVEKRKRRKRRSEKIPLGIDERGRLFTRLVKP
jgi:hypothetical protein